MQESQQTAPEPLQALKTTLEQEFDRAYYLSRYADVLKAGVDPLGHYLKHGWKEGRNPSPRFHTKYYLAKSPQVAALGVCPLKHYVDQGRSLGLSGHAFKPQTIQFTREVLGKDLATIDLAAATAYTMEMFDAAWYLAGKDLPPDALSRDQAFQNYEAIDLPAGVVPGPLFDAAHYLGTAANLGLDLRGADAAPFLHWLVHGVPAHVFPTRIFDPETYRLLNKDLASWNGWIFEHWIAKGIREDRPFDPNLRIGKSVLDKRGHVAISPTQGFFSRHLRDSDSMRYLDEIRAFRRSELAAEIVARAISIEPGVGDMTADLPSLIPPFFGGGFADFQVVISRIPRRVYRNVVLIPFCKMGGADYVAGVLTGVLRQDHGETLVLMTDDPSWERGDWFPADVPVANVSDIAPELPLLSRTRLLYEVIRWTGASRVFNVNSQLAYQTFSRYGARMSSFADLYTYYFCADRSLHGTEVGYPVRYFAAQLPIIKGALFDNQKFADELAERYCLNDEMKGKLHVLYQPPASPLRTPPAVEDQRSSCGERARPLILWAGRLDRQKRFDLVIRIAEAIPEVDFHCWGRAVLEQLALPEALPSNLVLHEPFRQMDELPLGQSDGWLYTSDWDGLPNILVECAAKGVPIVASLVGGIGELIDETTGWPVPGGSNPSEYVATLRAMLSDADERVARGRNLQTRVRERHSWKTFRERLNGVLHPELA